jgi:hypothetical protein
MSLLQSANTNSRIETLTLAQEVEGWDTKRVPIHVLMPLTGKYDTALTQQY